MKQLIGLKDIKYELNHLDGNPHVLFSGPRGSGKTQLARYIAENRKRKLIFVTGNTLKLQELLNIFIQIEEGDVLCIDEIHRLNPRVEEALYSPMEYFRLPIQGVAGGTQEYDLPKFTLIGTTTKSSKLSKPLLSRFQLMYQIPHYTLRELARIVKQEQPQMTIKETLLIAVNIVTPREAINLAYRVSQLGKDVKKNLEFIGYKFGLSKMERFYLKIIHNVGSLSLNSLVAALQLDKDEVVYIEDKLIRKRLVQIGSKGRSLTFAGLQKIKEIKKG